jgi:hypothetical protein
LGNSNFPRTAPGRVLSRGSNVNNWVFLMHAVSLTTQLKGHFFEPSKTIQSSSDCGK